MKSIVVRTSFVDQHCWPNAPQEVAYLRDLHRHRFYVTVYARVSHGNRQLEFHLFQDYISKFTVPYLQACLLNSVNSLSCEDMAEILALKLREENFGVFRVVVSEDNENDGMWELDSPLTILAAALDTSAEYWRQKHDDPHGISTALYVSHKEIAGIVQKAITGRS